MPEYASNSKGNTGVTLGAIGTAGTALAALGAFNGNGCGKGLLGNLFGNNCNNDNCCDFVRKETFGLGLQDATQKAELYTDRAVEAAGRDMIKEFRNSDAMITAVQKEANIELVRTRENLATLQAEVNCLQKEIQAQNKLLEQKVDYENRLTNQKIDCLKNEFASAIALEGERRLAGDNSLMQYVQANCITGELVMPLNKICPEAMPRYNCWQAPTCGTTPTEAA